MCIVVTQVAYAPKHSVGILTTYGRQLKGEASQLGVAVTNLEGFSAHRQSY